MVDGYVYMGCVYSGVSRQAIYVYIGLKGSINIVNCCQIFIYEMVTLQEQMCKMVTIREQMCKMVTKRYH